MAYKIQQGDTLSKIASQQGTSVAELQKLNPQITNPNLIYAGQSLAIPADSLTTQNKPVEMPASPVDTNADTYSNVMGSNSYYATQDTQDTMPSWLQSYLESSPAPTNPADTYSSLYNQSGIDENQNLVNESQNKINALKAQLQGINAETTQAGLKLREEGISAGAISGRNIANERQAAIRALPIQAQIIAEQATLTGNTALLEQAKEKLNLAFKLQSDYEQKVFDYNQAKIDKVWEYASDLQKEKLSQKKLQQEQDFQVKRDEASRQHDIAMKELDAKLNPKKTTTEAPTIKSINGVDMQWNPATSKWETVSTIGPTGNAQFLAQSQGNINNITELLKSGGMSTAVGTNILSRSPRGFWGAVGKIATVIGIPGLFKDTWKSTTGQTQNFISGVEQLSSQLSLDSLIQAKAKGATFGALSDTEMRILASSATKLGTWVQRDKNGNAIGYNTTEKAFKAELDKINNFAKLDYILKGGSPADVGVVQQEDGTYWTQNSDGTYTKLQ